MKPASVSAETACFQRGSPNPKLAQERDGRRARSAQIPALKQQSAASWQLKSRGQPYLCTISAATFKLAASRESFCFTSSNGSRVPAEVAHGETNPSSGSPDSSALSSLRQVAHRRRVKRSPARRGREGKQGCARGARVPICSGVRVAASSLHRSGRGRDGERVIGSEEECGGGALSFSLSRSPSPSQG